MEVELYENEVGYLYVICGERGFADLELALPREESGFALTAEALEAGDTGSWTAPEMTPEEVATMRADEWPAAVWMPTGLGHGTIRLGEPKLGSNAKRYIGLPLYWPDVEPTDADESWDNLNTVENVTTGEMVSRFGRVLVFEVAGLGGETNVEVFDSPEEAHAEFVSRSASMKTAGSER